MKPLIVIPARGGSKGIPGKNIKQLGGKPLIEYTVSAARGVFPDNVICVSTDTPEIKSVVEELGLRVPFLRPEELATDTAGTREVLLHAIEHYESTGYSPDTLILLQPTSPFRISRHIKEAMHLFDAQSCDMVVSVKETKSNPYYVLFEENSSGFLVRSKTGNYIRRQDCPKVWEYNGAIYIMRIDALKSQPIGEFTEVVKYEMDEIHSHDIDTPFDWIIAERILDEVTY